jgi:hypothetical protein
MALEEKIEKLNATMEKVLARLEAGASITGAAAVAATAPKAEKPAKAEKAAPVAPPKAEKPAKAKAPSVEDAMAAATEYSKANGRPAAKALIKQHGGQDVASIPEGKRAAFIAACQPAEDEAEEEAEEEAEDEDDGL